MRFCNLSCGYCNEYDKVSEPVPLDEMNRRIDHLGRLGTAMIGISGGEPLTHPQLDDIIRRMRRTGAIAGMITNGYLLNQSNASSASTAPASTTCRSPSTTWSPTKSRRKASRFSTRSSRCSPNTPNSTSISTPWSAEDSGSQRRAGHRQARARLGFESTIGIIHDGDGQLKPLLPEEAKVYFEMTHRKKTNYSRFDKFQEAIAEGGPTTGAAALARATSTSAKTAWCTTARSSAATPACPSPNTPPPT
jgi:hypothetical protein